MIWLMDHHKSVYRKKMRKITLNDVALFLLLFSTLFIKSSS